MIAGLYVEAAARSLPRTHAIMQRFSKLPVIPCERYTEVFNPRSQNFRLQKARPSLIPAHKFDGFVLPTPEGYGIGGRYNYYFSHMMNCLCAYIRMSRRWRGDSTIATGWSVIGRIWRMRCMGFAVIISVRMCRTPHYSQRSDGPV